LTACLFYLLQIVRPGGERLGKRAGSFLSWAVGCHVAVFVLKLVILKRWPAATIFEMAFLISLSLALIYLVTERLIGKRSGGLFLVPLVLVLLVVSELGGSLTVSVNPVLQSFWFAVHTLVTIVSYTGFFIGAQFSVMYLLLFRSLKNGTPGAVISTFPSLDTLDRLIHYPNVIGYVFLTFCIVSGALWAKGVWGSFFSWDMKQVATLVVWLWYSAYLYFHRSAYLSSRRSAVFSIVGFTAIIFTFFFVNILFRSIHGFV